MTSHEHLETRVWKPKLSEQGKGHKSDGQKQIWKIQKGAHGILENKVDGSFGIKAERSKKVEAARLPPTSLLRVFVSCSLLLYPRAMLYPTGFKVQTDGSGT
ncbi:Nuclear fragile X mental retardation-interacting protein 2 [Manis javanica]|nr:Nuclear fragile X mental retardation-interacting protein 2 [Manis javanica]